MHIYVNSYILAVFNDGKALEMFQVGLRDLIKIAMLPCRILYGKRGASGYVALLTSYQQKK